MQIRRHVRQSQNPKKERLSTGAVVRLTQSLHPTHQGGF